MLNYLKLEYQKFGKNAVITMLVSLYVLFLPTLIFIGKEVPAIPPVLLSNDIFFEFPTIWEWMGFAGNWLVFFCLGFVAVHIITSEVQNKTMRQAVINGQTRTEFFIGKVVLIFTISFFATLYYVFATMVIGWFSTDDPSFAEALEGWPAMLRYFLMCLGYLSFGLMIGIVIRKSGIAVLTFWSYILLIEPLIRWRGHKQIFDNESMNYWPMNAVEDLQPFPFYRFGSFMPDNLNFNILLDYQTAVILTIFYTILFLGLAYWSLLKKDM
jgi:ABC-type transport system involved in multi-copper enzyme maturation permease subunit